MVSTEITQGLDSEIIEASGGAFNDQLAASQFAQFATGKLVARTEDESWLAWNGRCWSETGGTALAKVVYDGWLRALLERAAAVTGEAQAAYVRRFEMLASRNMKKIVLELANSKLLRSRADFDLDALDLLNTPSGIVDLRTGTLAPNDPARYLTQCTAVAYNPRARDPERFCEVMWNLAGRDEATCDWLWRAIGYTLTGHVREDAFFFLRGEGSNGKSTMLKALRVVLGDYAHALDIQFLTAGKNAGHSTEFAALRGKRLLLLSEVGRGDRLALPRLKDLTGGEISNPRDMYESARSAAAFEPTAKPWCFGNHDLVITGDDHGTWRRIHKIESNLRFAHSGVRDGLAAAEGEGILRCAVDAAGAWYAQGLGAPPKRVAEATRKYREDQDLLGRFFTDCLVFERGAFTSQAALVQHYEQWRRDEGLEHGVGAREMGQRLEAKGATRARSRTHGLARGWAGVRLARRGDAAPA